ncbi:hypothetical protein [Nonomuraea zeae]|nr:hypothetical protein [Nonomuraea zeae]
MDAGQIIEAGPAAEALAQPANPRTRDFSTAARPLKDTHPQSTTGGQQ